MCRLWKGGGQHTTRAYGIHLRHILEEIRYPEIRKSIHLFTDSGLDENTHLVLMSLHSLDLQWAVLFPSSFMVLRRNAFLCLRVWTVCCTAAWPTCRLSQATGLRLSFQFDDGLHWTLESRLPRYEFDLIVAVLHRIRFKVISVRRGRYMWELVKIGVDLMDSGILVTTCRQMTVRMIRP